MLKMTRIKLEKYVILASTYLLKKGKEEEFLTLLKDMLKQIINRMTMILKNRHDMNNLYGWAMSEYPSYEGGLSG